LRIPPSTRQSLPVIHTGRQVLPGHKPADISPKKRRILLLFPGILIIRTSAGEAIGHLRPAVRTISCKGDANFDIRAAGRIQ